MAYNEALADRVAKNIGTVPGLVEKKMFGGIGYMLDGNMCLGTHGDGLMVRVGLEAYEDCLDQAGVRVMDLTGRVMKGWVTVPMEYAETDQQVMYWINRSLEFVTTLAPK